MIENEIVEFIKHMKFRKEILRDYQDPTYEGPFVKPIYFYKKIFKKDQIDCIKVIKKELVENHNIPKDKIYSRSWSLFGDLYIMVKF